MGRVSHSAGSSCPPRRGPATRTSASDRTRWPPPASRSSTARPAPSTAGRSEEHTSELQSLMRISYAVFCLKKKKNKKHTNKVSQYQHNNNNNADSKPQQHT